VKCSASKLRQTPEELQADLDNGTQCDLDELLELADRLHFGVEKQLD
jgi:hypothetical protein